MLILATLAALAATAGIEKVAEDATEGLIKHFKNEGEHFNEDAEIEDIFREYMKIALKKNLQMQSVAFKNQDKTLFDLYYPLFLMQDGVLREYPPDFGIRWKHTHNVYCIHLSDTCLDEIGSIERLLIIDRAGMGKTTIAQYLFALCVDTQKYIPIIIKLRMLSKDEDIWKNILCQFDLLDRHLSMEQIQKEIKKGGFLMVFEGFDEVKDEYKELVSEMIKDLVYTANKNCYVITSREDPILSSFHGYQRFHIRPLDFEDATKLITKIDNGQECSKELIKYLVADRNTIREFIGNPLMVSLIYRSFSYHRNIPAKKKDFYQQVYEALFKDHDYAQGFLRNKKSGLTIEQFETVMRGLGWLSYEHEQIEFSKTELLELIQEAIVTSEGVKTDAESVLDDLLNTVQLFEALGDNRYKWCHKSFSEYFAARCITIDFLPTQKQEIIEQLFQNNNATMENRNLIDFYTEMDYKACRDYLYIPYLERLINDIQRIFQDENALITYLIEHSLESLDIAIQNYLDDQRYFLREDIRGTYLFKKLFHIESVNVDEESIPCYVYNTHNEPIRTSLLYLETDDLYFFDNRESENSHTYYLRVEGGGPVYILSTEKVQYVLEMMKKERNKEKHGRFNIRRK